MKFSSSFTINATLPFHFDGTFHKPSHFPDKLSDWEPGKYWQTLRIGHDIFGIKIEDQKQKLKVTVYAMRLLSDRLNISSSFLKPKDKIDKNLLEEIKNEIIWRFGLLENITQFIKLCSQDKRFYPIFKNPPDSQK